MGLKAIIDGIAVQLRLGAVLIFVCATASAQTIRYAYDDAKRLAQVTAPDGKAARYTYDGAGRLTATERDLNPKNGQSQTLVTYRHYDVADRVVSIAHVRKNGGWDFLVAGQAIARAPGGAIQGIDTFRSGVYDVATGQFTGIPAVAQAFEYDGNSRLTRERRTKNGATIDARYEYDAVGNRKAKAVVAPAGTESTQYLYDAADRLMEERTTLASGNEWIVYYAWDGNGNLAGKSEFGRVTLYRFDPQSRLIDIRTGASVALANATAPSVSYAYDAQGNRVGKRAAGERGYMIDSSYTYPQLAAETWSTGRSYYVRGLDVVRQTIEGGPLLVHLFPLHGHLGTSIGAVDAAGDVVEEVDADAFGNLDQTAELRQGHVYAGEYWDQDAQLLYLRARWYDPKVGRFISGDPYEGRQRDPRSLNRYAYAHSDPVHGRDPSGKFSLSESTMASNIQTTLSGLQADFGFNMIGGALNPQDALGVDDVAFGVLGVLAPQAKIVARLTKRANHLKLGRAANSEVLGDNLRVLGKLPGGSADQAHHIVAGRAAAAEQSRNILGRHGIDINAPVNGVWLPRSAHCGGHCDNYYNEVNRILQEADAAGGKSAVMAALQDLERRLIAGEIRVHR